ncbi:MAG: thiol protease/hemagglutinin PrtT [Muribaculaceae bacterium]|nr:thiol protease/hemagglutinin PrtT [Muribaculaceae bacterium]
MKKISQSILAAAVVAVAGVSASAEVLSPEAALSRALPQVRKSAPALTQPVLVYTAEASELPAAYVFSKENSGFIVVAADDAVAPVLGYSDKGNFNAENMAPGLKYWLGEYARQIEFARENGQDESTPRLARPERTPIAPLLKTQWGQDAPYNLLCPTGQGGHMPTGCVATAASQIMKYHQWPAKGHDGFSYATRVNGESVELSINLEETPLQWSLMQDVYTSSATEEQKMAVAELMIAVGYGVEMSYSPSASGAQTGLVSKILANNFDYDKSVCYIARNCYTLDEWESIMYDQLTKNQPVLLDGTTINAEGHAFVCDGYDKDGLFHINWGWDGSSNGYFLLGALDPANQGTGGASSGMAFNFGQDATINIKPNANGEAIPVVQASGTGLNITGPSGAEFNLGRAVTVSYDNGGFWNHNWNPIEPKWGLHIVGGGKDFYRWSTAAVSEITQNYGKASYEVILSGVEPNSEYVLTPAYKIGDNCYEVGMPYGCVRSYKLTTSVTTGKLQAIGNDVTVTDIQIPALIKNRDRINLSATFSNSGEYYYYGHFVPCIFQKVFGAYDVVTTLGDDFTVNLNPGETYNWLIEGMRVTSGLGLTDGKDYYFGFTNSILAGANFIENIVGPLAPFHYGTVAGIDEVKADDTIAVITPNPADSHFTVQGVEVSSVKVFSLAGNLVAAANEATVDVAHLAAGLYLVEVVAADGNHSTARLIKK